ncbi:MAG: NifB/NifX family molybdenum-iron cluster-binding protein [Thermotogae bacterium]|nr:NifB/NifX family molybdenum-iron cluster-binding protein [Thermotogota bacterium]
MGSFGKIAVPSKGKTLDSMVDDRFARARNFIIYDSEEKEIVEIVNNETDQAHGMGPKIVQLLESKKVKTVIAPSVGLNAFESLKTAGIEIYLFSNGTVKEALEKLDHGELKKMESPSN